MALEAAFDGTDEGAPQLLPVVAGGDVDVELDAWPGVGHVVVARQVIAGSGGGELAGPGGDDVHDRRIQLGGNAAARFKSIEGLGTFVGAAAGKLFDHRLEEGELRDLQLVMVEPLADPGDGGVGPVGGDFGPPGKDQFDALEAHCADLLDGLVGAGIAGARLWKFQLTELIRGRAGDAGCSAA